MKGTERRKTTGAQVDRNTESSRIEADVDFGTYHHSTPDESKAVRARAEEVFSKLLGPLYPADAHLQILDAGCGLGFLMYVAAKCFPNASITGIDVFKHKSVSNLSIKNAERNMELLGIDSRTSFLKHDLTKPLSGEVQYDLVVSNVVFHNMGKSRFNAYETVFHVLKPGGFFVLGDLFPKGKEDLEYFRAHLRLIDESNEGNAGRWVYGVKVLRKSE